MPARFCTATTANSVRLGSQWFVKRPPDSVLLLRPTTRLLQAGLLRAVVALMHEAIRLTHARQSQQIQCLQ